MPEWYVRYDLKLKARAYSMESDRCCSVNIRPVLSKILHARHTRLFHKIQPPQLRPNISVVVRRRGGVRRRRKCIMLKQFWSDNKIAVERIDFKVLCIKIQVRCAEMGITRVSTEIRLDRRRKFWNSVKVGRWTLWLNLNKKRFSTSGAKRLAKTLCHNITCCCHRAIHHSLGNCDSLRPTSLFSSKFPWTQPGPLNKGPSPLAVPQIFSFTKV